MHDLQSIHALLLTNLCINKDNFYLSLNLRVNQLTDTQNSVLLHLHKLICVAHTTHTIKFKATRLARQLLLVLLELNSVEKDTPLRVQRLLLCSETMAKTNIYRILGVNRRHLNVFERDAAKTLRREVMRAHQNRTIAQSADALTIRALLLIQNAKLQKSHICLPPCS